MPFSLYNALSTFQLFINDTLCEFLNNFASAYLDNVLIFSKTEEEHYIYIQKVIKRLYNVGLQIDINKYEFRVIEMQYLGLIISNYSIKIDLVKVVAVLDQETLSYLKDV